MGDADRNPQRWREGFRALKDETEALTRDLSREAFNRAPVPEKWSVGQCLDHLNEAGRLLVPRLEAALAEARREGRLASETEPRLRLFDRLFAWLNGPNAWLKMPAPGAYRPAPGDLDPAATTRAFQTLQDDLVACVEAAEGLDWSAVKATSPASRFVRLSVGGWLETTLAHQRRHVQQARTAKAHVVEAREV